MSRNYDDMFHRPNAGWTQRVGEPTEAVEDEPARSTEDGLYRPYGVTPTDDLDSCDIAWWLGHDTPQGQDVQYRFIVRIGYVGEEQINLFLTDAIISIEGRNLTELRKRLRRRKVTFIQAFNPKRWPILPPPNEPLVQKISIHYPGEPDMFRLRTPTSI